jgi:type II secretory pathway predicted ATPase ExeA
MYTDFYKLRDEPFLLTPDERFYFESSVHSQAMAHLTYGLQRGEGFIVITGDVGAGKTTLVKRLIAKIDPKKVVAAHVVTTLLSGHDLLRMVAAALGLNDLPADKSGVLLRLQTFFETTHRQGRRALLIVDEAQNLSEGALEELRMLSNIQVGNAAPFQSFLVGQPQFRRIIASPDLEQLRQRVIASYHLGPLNAPGAAPISASPQTRSAGRTIPFDVSAMRTASARTAASAPPYPGQRLDAPVFWTRHPSARRQSVCRSRKEINGTDPLSLGPAEDCQRSKPTLNGNLRQTERDRTTSGAAGPHASRRDIHKEFSICTVQTLP